MSASRNPDAMAGKAGQEIGSHVPRDEPMTTHGHQPGKLIGNDAVPEFHAKTLPPGTAPASNTFEPNTTSEVPGQADNDSVLRSHGKESTQTTASSTLGGATSADVHTGLGHPGQGQSSSELRDGSKSGAGLASVGASGASSGNMGVDERLQAGQRGLEKDFPAGTKEGTGQEKGLPAAEREGNEL